MKRVVIGVVLGCALVAGGLYLRSRLKSPEGEEAYVGERNLTIWSRLAQVREPVATLRYGERVAVLVRKNDQVQLRTAAGTIGWTEQRFLLDAALWRRATELRERVRQLPLQARGRTRVLTNVRIEPGRAAPRLFQFGHGVALEILERKVAEVSLAGEELAPQNVPGEAPPEAREVKKEDWVLVRGSMEDVGQVAGWVLRRFIEYDVPQEIADYGSGFRFVAWFELNRVADGATTKPQFLAAGVQGGDGQPCDFTLLRVYTWESSSQRYQTAYVQSNLCGRFPIRAEPATAPGGDARFSFIAAGKRGDEPRAYRIHQTTVRRIGPAATQRPGARPRN